jgi:acyl carrier protein
MNRDEIKKKTIDTIKLFVPPDEDTDINEDTDFLDAIGDDRLDAIMVQIALEEKFSIQINDEDLAPIGVDNFRVGDWVDRIVMILQQQTQGE